MTVPIPGNNIRASDIFNLTEFTPSFTGLSTGTGATSEGWYSQIGNLVFWGFRVQLGSSPSSSATVVIDLPVDAWTGGGNGLQAVVGSFVFRDASTVNFYAGTATVHSSGGTNASFCLGSNVTRLGNSVPVAFAVDDVISASGVYQAQ